MTSDDRHRAAHTAEGRNCGLWGRLRLMARAQGGTALTEAAITLPVFLVILSGMLTLVDIMRTLNVAEVSAYQDTANTAMEAQRLSVPDAVFDDDGLGLHLSPGAASARVDEQYSVGGYPAFQPGNNVLFDHKYLDTYSYESLLEATTAGNRDTADLQPLMGDTTGNPTQIRSRLYGHPTYWANHTLDDRATGEFAFSIDTSAGLFDNLIGIANEALDSTGSRHAVATGLRYGVAIGDHREEATHALGRFDYDIDHRRYYATELPPQVNEEEAKPDGRRAVAITRLSMADTIPYNNVLRIGYPGDSVSLPGDDERISEVDPDTQPDDPEDLFGPILHYASD